MKQLLAALFLHLTVAGIAFADTATGIVVRVVDGDTVVIRLAGTETNVRCRLAGIDAPEKKQTYGREAADILRTLALNKTVRIEFDRKDIFGRIIGTVYLANDKTRSLNRTMLSRGCAWHYRRYSRDKTLARLEQSARTANLGLWQSPTPTPPWTFRQHH